MTVTQITIMHLPPFIIIPPLGTVACGAVSNLDFATDLRLLADGVLLEGLGSQVFRLGSLGRSGSSPIFPASLASLGSGIRGAWTSKAPRS